MENAEELAKLAQVVFFDRPGLNLNEEMIKRFNMKQIDGNSVDVSSTSIRELKSLNAPREVINFIIDNNLYFMQN